MLETHATAGNPLSTGLDDFASYLERSSYVVQEYTDFIEHKYVYPALEHFSAYFRTQPTSTTLLTITLILFTVMSILPVLSFIGISVFAVCSSMFLALTFALIVIIAIEATFFMILLVILGALLLFSFGLTAGGTMIYLAYRLIKHLQTHDGRSGINTWVQETRQYFTLMKLADNDNFGVFTELEIIGQIKNGDRSSHYSS